MPDLKWKLEMAPGFDATITALAKEQVATEMRRRLLINRGEIMMKIGAYLKLVFWNTPVCKAMTGRDYSLDLPAEFGITDQQMMVVAEHMAEIIGEKMAFTGPGLPFEFEPGTVMVARVQAVSADWPLYELGDLTAYQSNPSEAYIKWMQWMLEEPEIDFITAGFDIVYKGESAIYDTRIEKKSRSGRAVMASLKQLEAYGLTKGGWLFPDICRQKVGKNFLQYTFEQPGVGQHVMDIVKEYL